MLGRIVVTILGAMAFGVPGAVPFRRGFATLGQPLRLIGLKPNSILEANLFHSQSARQIS